MASSPSGRELEVFAAYCRCGSMRRAAEVLGVKEQTVKNHLSRLYRALEVPGNLPAAIALGWLFIPASLAPGPRLIEADALARLAQIREDIDAVLEAAGG